MDIFQTFFKYANQWLMMLPLGRKVEYSDLFTNPNNHSKHIASSSIRQGVLDWAIGFFPMFLLSAVNFVITIFLGPTGFGANTVTILLAYIIGLPIFSFILSFVIAGAELLVARLFGGKGTYATHYGLTSAVSTSASLVVLPVYGVSALLGNVPLIGCISCLLAPVLLALGLWSIYLHIKAVAAVHSVDTMKALVIFLVPAVLIGIAMLIIYFVLVALLINLLVPNLAQGPF